MNKFLLHKKMYGLFAMILFCMCSFSFAQPVKRGTLKVTFVQTANGKDIVLKSSATILGNIIAGNKKRTNIDFKTFFIKNLRI